MSTVPRIIDRTAHLVEMAIRNSADVLAYRFSGAWTMNQAFTSTTTMFTVGSGCTYRSPSVRSRRLGLTDSTIRNLTKVWFDPEDFWTAGGTMPHDTATLYLRTEEQGKDLAWRPVGPILIVPPAGFFVTTRPSITVAGTAPMIADGVTLCPPVGALHFVFPKFVDTIDIRNLDTAHELTIAFNPGMPGFKLPFGEFHQFSDAANTDVYVWGTAGTIMFNIYSSVVNAEMA